MTDLKSLQELIKMMAEHGLSEIDLELKGGEKVSLKRGPTGEVQMFAAPTAPAPVAAPPPAPAPTPAPTAEAPADTSGGDSGGGTAIESPMVGTFYAAASPEADAFVKVGDKVTADTVVCIIEAMKVMNEIKAETSGTITEVCLDNGQPVEFGQPLFRVS